MLLSKYVAILGCLRFYILIKVEISKSTPFHQLLEAFGIQKCRTTAYHPQGDGMMDRSLLQLFRCYNDTEDDWERYLPLVLYAYRTTQHSSTGVSPFQLMLGRPPQLALFQQPIAFDPTTYLFFSLTS